ncbi:uncharacterized protein LOC126835789 [Adelges cooleyi]|uniref:uncharacterized protein LOC126835789 n=1 Tax=Adelges cooleyi TaxID=133065 RepID=UPI00217F3C8F|nr:uncharacterized protein LOC126835789 [Adelges cooleyi]
MKPLSILISIVLVNVLVAELDNYVKEVIMTNQQMTLAKAKLPRVIKNIVLADYTMVEIALMLAVPETETNLLSLPLDKIRYQQTIQTHIWFLTGFNTPGINEVNLSNTNLSVLGNERRRLTSAATKGLIREEIGGFTNDFSRFSDMCRLIGVFINTIFPNILIALAVIVGDICCITTTNNRYMKYKYINDEIWELNTDNTKFQPLAFQVL